MKRRYGNSWLDDILFFAPDDGDGDGGDDGGGGGGDDGDDDGDDGAKGADTDIDKIRSSYDKQIADLGKQITDLTAKLEESEKSDTTESARKAAVAKAEGFRSTIRKELEGARTPEQLQAVIQKADEAIAALGRELGETSATEAAVQGMFKNSHAQYLAIQIQMEHGGDAATYAKRLEKASTQREMELMAKEIRLEVAGNGGGGEGGGRNRGRRQPDQGRGRNAAPDVGKEIADIDISTPEGREQWTKNRSRFATAVRAR